MVDMELEDEAVAAVVAPMQLHLGAREAAAAAAAAALVAVAVLVVLVATLVARLSAYITMAALL